MASETVTIDTDQNPMELRGSKVGINESKERINRWDGSCKSSILQVVASVSHPTAGLSQKQTPICNGCG